MVGKWQVGTEERSRLYRDWGLCAKWASASRFRAMVVAKGPPFPLHSGSDPPGLPLPRPALMSFILSISEALKEPSRIRPSFQFPGDTACCLPLARWRRAMWPGDHPPPPAPAPAAAAALPRRGGSRELWEERRERRAGGWVARGLWVGHVALTSGLFSTSGSSQRVSTLKKYQGRPSW